MPELNLLFLQMAIILATARLMALALRYVGQPEVVGEMIAGILLGPSLLGKISPWAMATLFPDSGLAPLYSLSQVGLVLFMFLIGLEVQPGATSGSARSVIFTSYASIAAPFVCGALLAWKLYPQLGNGVPILPFVLFLGAAISVTAFPVLARILTDRKLMNTRVGMFAIACAAVDDVTAWCMLAVITVIARPGAVQTPLSLRFAMLGLYVLVMWFVVRPVLRRLIPEGSSLGFGRFGMVMVFMLISACTTDALSVHALFGAFLAGLVMPRGSSLEKELRGRMESITLGLLLPLFFAYTGLRTSIGLLNTPGAWLTCALIILVAVASKLIVSAGCVRASGLSWRESIAVGVLVNTRGLVGLIILNAGLDLHILSPLLFSMMVIMALVTTLMSVPLIDWILPARSTLDRTKAVRHLTSLEPELAQTTQGVASE
jgi:Kef-type K+ transport system membrane component KefB